MVCQNCGNELKDSASFCPKCGKRIPTLEEAIVSFKNGNNEAFDIIYNESKRYVYYTILKSTCDRDVAEDILQDTYLDVYKSLGQLENPAVFKVWAAKIAQHKISRYYKKNNPDLFSSEEEMDDIIGDITENDMDSLPEDAMINKEVQRLIGEIIEELPENQRSAVIAFYYNQMTISEIAESMELPENTVKTYLFRGKKKIKEGVLEIEKKHGTKLYALPLAGLLGLLFTEEAKAETIAKTATEILHPAANSVVSGFSAASSSISDSARQAGARFSSVTDVAAEAPSYDTVVSHAATGGIQPTKGMGTSAMTDRPRSATGAVNSERSVNYQPGVYSGVENENLSGMSGIDNSAISPEGKSRGRRRGMPRGQGKPRKHGRTVLSVIIHVSISLIVGFIAGVFTTVIILNDPEKKESVQEVPVICKIIEIGIPEAEKKPRTPIGKWINTGVYLDINEDKTFLMYEDESGVSFKGGWSEKDNVITFIVEYDSIEEMLWFTITSSFVCEYDPDDDTLTMDVHYLGFDLDAISSFAGESNVFVRLE